VAVHAWLFWRNGTNSVVWGNSTTSKHLTALADTLDHVPEDIISKKLKHCVWGSRAAVAIGFATTCLVWSAFALPIVVGNSRIQGDSHAIDRGLLTMHTSAEWEVAVDSFAFWHAVLMWMFILTVVMSLV
jgi:hypothetical protein